MLLSYTGAEVHHPTSRCVPFPASPTGNDTDPDDKCFILLDQKHSRKRASIGTSLVKFPSVC